MLSACQGQNLSNIPPLLKNADFDRSEFLLSPCNQVEFDVKDVQNDEQMNTGIVALLLRGSASFLSSIEVPSIESG